jgi:hypothetical protein
LIPVDPLIFEYDLSGKPLLDLPDEATAVRVVREMMDRMMDGKKEGGNGKGKGH